MSAHTSPGCESSERATTTSTPAAAAPARACWTRRRRPRGSNSRCGTTTIPETPSRAARAMTSATPGVVSPTNAQVTSPKPWAS